MEHGFDFSPQDENVYRFEGMLDHSAIARFVSDGKIKVVNMEEVVDFYLTRHDGKNTLTIKMSKGLAQIDSFYVDRADVYDRFDMAYRPIHGLRPREER